MGEFLLFLLILIPVGMIGYKIYKYFYGRRMVVSDQFYSQNGVRIDYANSQITIGKYVYAANKVTGINAQYNNGGARNSHQVNIEVDDMAKPVHRIVIVGSKHQADEFMQRLSVALRKAGGTSFT